MLSILLKAVNKRLLFYLVLFSLIITAFLYQKLKIQSLEKEISQIKTQLKEKQTYLKICKTNIKTLEENSLSKEKVINQLQKEIKNQKITCQNLLQKKEKLISDLRKLKAEKPKNIKPTVIVKKECKLKIETGEQLYEKDFIFDTLSGIGK